MPLVLRDQERLAPEPLRIEGRRIGSQGEPFDEQVVLRSGGICTSALLHLYLNTEIKIKSVQLLTEISFSGGMMNLDG